MKNNELLDCSFSFALRIVKLSSFLVANKEYVISRQVLRSGTSIGANITEAQQAESKKDFVHKLAIANKEAFETEYWIRLLRESDLLGIKVADSLIEECNSLQKMLTSALKKLRKQLD